MRRIRVRIITGFQAFSLAGAFWLSGCVVRNHQQAKVTVPPPPAPIAPVPTPPPQPLSIPQTQTRLPPPQEISPEALASLQSANQNLEAQATAANTVRPARRPAGPVAGPKPDTSQGAGVGNTAQAAAGTQPAAAGTPAEAEPRPTVQEIVPPAEVKKIQDLLAARNQEVNKVLDTAEKHHPNREQRVLIGRIKSFLTQSADAEKRNDWRQADILAERAQVLAKELSSGNQ